MSQHREGAPDGAGPDADPLDALSVALEGAETLDPDARIALLGEVEAGIAAALRGLDGL